VGLDRRRSWCSLYVDSEKGVKCVMNPITETEIETELNARNYFTKYAVPPVTAKPPPDKVIPEKQEGQPLDLKNKILMFAIIGTLLIIFE